MTDPPDELTDRLVPEDADGDADDVGNDPPERGPDELGMAVEVPPLDELEEPDEPDEPLDDEPCEPFTDAGVEPAAGAEPGTKGRTAEVPLVLSGAGVSNDPAAEAGTS